MKLWNLLLQFHTIEEGAKHRGKDHYFQHRQLTYPTKVKWNYRGQPQPIGGKQISPKTVLEDEEGAVIVEGVIGADFDCRRREGDLHRT